MDSGLDQAWGFALEVIPLNPLALVMYPELAPDNDELHGLNGVELRYVGEMPATAQDGEWLIAGMSTKELPTGIGLKVTTPNMMGCVVPLEGGDGPGLGSITNAIDYKNHDEIKVKINPSVEDGTVVSPGDPIAKLVMLPFIPFSIMLGDSP